MNDNLSISFLLIILFSGFYVSYYIYDKIMEKNKDELEKIDIFFSIIQKSLFSFLTILISVITVIVSIANFLNSKTEFEIQNFSQINTDNKENDQFVEDRLGNRDQIYSYHMNFETGKSVFEGIPIIISNTGNVRDSIKSISISVFDESEILETFYSKKVIDSKIDRSSEIWLEPKETLEYTIDGNKMKSSIQKCIERLEERGINDSLYRVYYIREDDGQRADSGKISTRIKLITGSNKEVEMKQRSFDLNFAERIEETTDSLILRGE
ncbi:hypothetical protein [Enterococcus wangshanyuanii]|uniref:Uncharacterized protein n=1 Tax=Enterococcus wangshanyuanii TaxID=2005703 RepID=A0ABQ1NF03_9ENTE|nr:hypothetical protein [Enterococcus wangshanyuanii]GGC75096.1 hypothetical protein GCM10011573_00790 [Enterococcus wangshanyuanii]